MKELLNKERVLLEFVDPRTGKLNQFLLGAYDGDKAAIFWLELRSTTVVGDDLITEIKQEWWEKDWWCFNSWAEAERSITYINGEAQWHK